MTLDINDKQLKKLIEATIFVSKDPLNITDLFEGVLDNINVTRRKVKSVISALQHDYLDRGINLIETSSGFSFKTTPEINEPLSYFWAENAPRYSRALLETLSLIAYKQPITRAEIEKVRGVGVSQTIVHTLTERKWIKVIGYKELPGRPSLYGTTPDFLDYFQIKSLEELPELSEISLGNHENKIPEQLDISIENSAELNEQKHIPKDNNENNEITPEGQE